MKLVSVEIREGMGREIIGQASALDLTALHQK
jgi:hypothetical protein